MRKVLNTLGRFFVVAVLGFSLAACGQSTPEPTPITTPTPTSEPTPTDPAPIGSECINSTITVEYTDGTTDTFDAVLTGHAILTHRYSTSVYTFDEDGALMETTTLVVSLFNDGTLTGAGSTTYFPMMLNKSFTVTDVSRNSIC